MKTEIAVVLDRSGSMASIAGDTMGGFNTFLKEQQLRPDDAKLTLVQFDHEYQAVVTAMPIQFVAPLTMATYQPRGTTALLDAMGRTITELGARFKETPGHLRPERVIVVIITDGLENASTRYTRAQVFDMVQHQRDVYKWEFLYLGANQDAIAVGQEMGIPLAAAMSYTAGPIGTRAIYRSVTQQVNHLRQDAEAVACFSTTDRAEATADDPVTTTTGTSNTWTAGD